MGRREDDDVRPTAAPAGADSDTVSEEDEEAIRAKLRESGWEKKRRKSSRDDGENSSKPATTTSADKDERDAGSDDKRRQSRRDQEEDDDKRRDRDRDRDRDRKGRGSRSRRSRSHRRDRDRDRDSHRRRDRSTRSSKGSSRRRSVSRSTSRSRSRSPSKNKSSESRKRRASKSRSHSSTRKDSKRSRARRSRSASNGDIATDKPDVKNEAPGATKTENDEATKQPADQPKVEPAAESNGSSTKERERDSVRNKDKGKDSAERDDRRKSRKSRRRSRSRSRTRSPSRSRRRRHRSRSRSRSSSRNRRRRSGASRSRSRSRSRRDRDHDRDRRRRGRNSRSRSRSRRRRSSSADKKRRDANSSPEPHEHPPINPPVPAPGPANPTITQLMQQYPTLSLQDIIAKMQASNVSMAAAVSMKPARELYVGNLPPNITGPQLQEFLGTIIQQVGLCAQPGNPIINTWISTDGHFAFCEMRSVEECNLALLLNQLSLLGQPLKFGRPKSFMGPPQPMPAISARTQTALVNLGCTPNPVWFASASGGPVQPFSAPGTVDTSSVSSSVSAMLGSVPGLVPSNRLLMMNIPTVLTEDQVKELVEPFGELKSFSLVKDVVTGQSTGSALFEYKDEKVTEVALNGLKGLDLAGNTLMVQRAPAEAGLAGQALPSAVQDETSPVIRMSNMVDVGDLEDDEEFADLKEDVEEECKRFGTVSAMEIPRPKACATRCVLVNPTCANCNLHNQDGAPPAAVGNIYVRFSNVSEAGAALKALSGRKFGGKIVKVTYYSLAKFEQKELA
ncbi:TPA: hypothetical protein N0F65_006530 [Lagenidium giganteum]|uniref:RRM domain-containing protein n=1 Tax=Lagenidium giganteum TaxID=4803 RepID=A0AAV2YFJ2_9STRA|nr:TPA: hypothetical protein N0F65_006530 [Lagenidium giganteum]